jgi:hypothetical protein
VAGPSDLDDAFCSCLVSVENGLFFEADSTTGEGGSASLKSPKGLCSGIGALPASAGGGCCSVTAAFVFSSSTTSGSPDTFRGIDTVFSSCD